MRKSIFGTAATSTPFRNSKASTSASPAPPVATPAKSRWRTIFHTNLFLLGFQPSIHATGTYAAIVFDEQMFSRGANNTKVMEVVAWFLFEKLDAATAQERFVDCWPIADTRKQPRQFRDVTYKWLEALRREGHLGNDPPLMRSYFEDCRGVRIERTMAAFSSHVLRIVMERDFKQYSKIPDIDIEGMSKNDRAELRDLLQMHIVAQSDEFFAETEYRRQAQERWYERANAITAQFRELQKRNGELEVMKQHLVHEKTRRHQNEPEILTNDDKDVEREEREGKGVETLEELEDIKQRRIEQVRQLWKECIEWMGNEEDSEKGEAQEGTKAMETIEMILHERANNHRVDGRSAKLEIPEWMIKEWDNEFKKGQIAPYQRGKLDFVSALRIWRLSLRSLDKAISEPRGPDSNDTRNDDTLDSMARFFERQLPELTEQKRDVMRLRNMLEERLKGIRKNCEALRVEIVDENRKLETRVTNAPRYPTLPFNLHPPVPAFSLSGESVNERAGTSDHWDTFPSLKLVKVPPTPEAIANIECIARENVENVVTIAAVRKSAANKTAINVRGHEHVDVKGTTQENRLPKAVAAVSLKRSTVKRNDVPKKEPRKPLAPSACFVNSVKAETESAHPLKADPEKESRAQSVIRSNAGIEAVKGREQEPEQRKKASGPAPRVTKSRTKSQSFPAVPSTVGRASPPKSSATRLGQNLASVSRRTTRNAYDILCEQIVDHVINEEGDAVTPPGQRKGRSHSRSKNNPEEQNVARTATTKKTMPESRNTSSGIAGFLIDEEEQTGWDKLMSQGIVSPLAAIDDKVFEHRSRLVRTPPDPLTSTPLASHSCQNPSFSSSPSPKLSESLFKPMLKSSARNMANTASTPTESLVSSEFEIERESPPAKQDEREYLRPPSAAKPEEKLLPVRKRLELRAQMETTARPYYPVISSRVSLSTSSTEVSPILARMGESPAWEFGHDAVRGFGGTGMDDLDRDADLRRLSVVSPLSGKELGVSNEEDMFGERLVTGLKRSRDLEGQKEYERDVKRPRDGKLDSELEKVKEELEDSGDTSLRAYNSAVDDDGDWAAGILDENAPPEFFDLENVGGDIDEPW